MTPSAIQDLVPRPSLAVQAPSPSAARPEPGPSQPGDDPCGQPHCKLHGAPRSAKRSRRHHGRLAALLATTVAAFTLTLTATTPAQATDDDDDADGRSHHRRSQGLPQYAVVPAWPKALPNNWIMGQVAGVAVDRHDRIWVLQRPASSTVDELGAAQDPPRSMCCIAAPPVMVFDTRGNLLEAWGGPGAGYEWPKTEHGIWVDRQDNVWVGGNAATDRQILKFSADGRFLLQIGHASADPLDSLRTDILGQVASLTVDDAAGEIYLADGYGNKRVIVFDSSSGEFKRLWGAYGRPPVDTPPGAYDPSQAPATQFRNPVHCVRIANDGLVYVCDRVNNRIQVFTKAGEYVKEFFVRRETLGNGSVWDLTFSKDGGQRYLFVIDGENNVVWTLERESGVIRDTQFRNGRNAGQFHWVHQAATDSEGNLYTGEVDTSKRVQKFRLRQSHR